MTRIKIVNGIVQNMSAAEEAEMIKLENNKPNKFNMVNEPEQPQYLEQRRNAYPEIGDQLDMLWHSIDQDPQLKSKYFDFYEAIKAVKVKYPKNG